MGSDVTIAPRNTITIVSRAAATSGQQSRLQGQRELASSMEPELSKCRHRNFLRVLSLKQKLLIDEHKFPTGIYYGENAEISRRGQGKFPWCMCGQEPSMMISTYEYSVPRCYLYFKYYSRYNRGVAGSEIDDPRHVYQVLLRVQRFLVRSELDDPRMLRHQLERESVGRSLADELPDEVASCGGNVLRGTGQPESKNTAGLRVNPF